MSNQQELVLKIVLDAWNGQLNRATKFFAELSDEQLKNQVAPNRNSGVYLLGHITAVHDGLLPLFGLGEKLYPELENIFIKNPDNAEIKKPSIESLRNSWKQVNEKLAEEFGKLSLTEWLQKHNSVSEEDFAKEPHRNRLNVLISRTNHIAYHLGQLAFLKSK
jgi:DinB superfamily